MDMEITTAALDVSGVRISPPELRFLDAVPGGCYHASLSVQNLEPQSCFLQILPPQRPQFKLIVENPKKPVASGLRITASVEYLPDREEDLQDRLLLYVDKKIIEIPLIGLFPCCCLEIEPEINFGTVTANGKVISKEIKITNHGSSSGAFNINYRGSVHIVISPTSGVVESKTFQVVKMEMCADIPRIINQTAVVELQGRSNAHITIKANIVEQIIELLGVLHSDTIKHVHFGCVYFGTSKTEEVILHNKSPEPMGWVAILQDNAVGGEMGTDIQKSTYAALQDLNYSENKAEVDVSTMISCIPNEGKLEPYQKIVVTLCFSPKQLRRNVKHDRTPSRQDYALFLTFEAVGSTDDFLERLSVDEKPTRETILHKVELALTGSGLPVMLTFSPGPAINFMECYMGEHTDIICTLKNECDILPVSFAFRKVAHYNICPAKGKVKAKSSQDVLFSFLPRHIGSFKVKQVVDIIGPVTKKDCLPELVTSSFHQIHLKFSGTCKSVTNKVMLKTNLGVLLSNKEDLYSYVTPMALLKSDQTQIHDHVLNRNLDDALIALPNDLPASLRPSERHNNYRTIFTKVARYNYVDPEYSYTAYEELEKQVNKDYYADYIHSLRNRRLNKEGARIIEKLNSVDLGLKPASGLKSPQLKALWQDKLEEDADLGNGNGLLTSQKLAEIESKSMGKEVSDGLSAVPSSPQEHEDCSLTLTSKQLHQIFIGPSTIDFGEVCVHSISVRKLHLVNNLPVHVWIQVGIGSEELQQTSPLSHVMSPQSRTYIPVVFETDKLGNFQKSFMYTINQHHTGHVLVVAKIVPVALELSTRELTLYPTSSFLAENGFRTTVTLYNHKNYPAQFIWKPIITDKGMAFSICPDKGTVEAYKDLECEVVWHPSFSSPVTGEFDLCVHQGKTLRLKCFAKLGSTSVQFKEQRITFNHAPIHLTTCKIVILQNVGHNHAYFQVVDASPLPGMIITPFQGVIPVGGRTELKIYFTPNALMKFDSRVEVSVRHAKSLELRLGGSVEVPDIALSMCSFVFPGVYVGSTQKIPFFIENKGKTRARVTFDLSNHDDFTLHFTPQPDACCSPSTPCLYTVIIDAYSALECSLNFTPKEVAAYDFSLLVHVNVSKTLSSSDNTVTNTSPAGSAKHLIVPHPQMLTIPTQLCKVQATVLQPPLELYYQDLTFQCNLRTIHLGIAHDSNSIKKLHLNNISKQQLMWKLDLDAAGKAVDDGFFKFSLQFGTLSPGERTVVTISFCPPACLGKYTAEVPLLLNNDTSVYRVVSLSGCVKSPKINFDPQILILTPVPLNIKTGADVRIIPQGYLRKTALQVEIPANDPEHNDQINPLSVELPNGNFIDITVEGKNIGFICRVNFCSSKPLSCMKNIYFVDEQKTRFPLKVATTAENCLLTVYPYLACHLKDQQIILKSDSNEIIYSNGESLQHPCYIPGTCSHTNSSSNFGTITNSTYENSIAEFEKEVENEKLKKNEAISQDGANRCYFDFSLFPAEGTEAYAFLQKVITAVQNWFALFGWSKGPNPISIPRTLRCDVCKIQMTSCDEKVKQNLGKDTKTIYDMLLHLSGQLLPGISSSQSLPFDPTQRVVQLHWQHSTMITFLKCQGAFFPHVLPQFLFDLDDYKRWTDLQSTLKCRRSEPEDIYILDDCSFEAISKRSWTDVLLQIYKILVLQRVSTVEVNTSSSPEDEEIMPKISTDPLSSNIYSPPERILLTWMNRHYEKTRKIVWKDCLKGDIPPTRWIVNFDRDLQDGLVLAAQVASYCPYLISTHFVNMYTSPNTSEQYFHNCLVLINAFHAINLDIDVLASDICDPNPIMMLMLCVYLYERLPQYLSKKYIEFSGPLHATVVRKMHLKNPSIKPLIYNATILGRDSADFSLPKGNTVAIAPKSQISIKVEFTSRFLHPAEAMLLLVSKTSTGVGGATMTFSLKTRINQIKPAGLLKCRSPCYELNTVILQVKSPFKTSGPFSVILVESTSCITEPEQLNQVSQIKQEVLKSPSSELLTLAKLLGILVSCQESIQRARFHARLLQRFLLPHLEAIACMQEVQATTGSSGDTTAVILMASYEPIQAWVTSLRSPKSDYDDGRQPVEMGSALEGSDGTRRVISRRDTREYKLPGAQGNSLGVLEPQQASNRSVCPCRNGKHDVEGLCESARRNTSKVSTLQSVHNDDLGGKPFVVMKAIHVAGEDNGLADWLSRRRLDQSEWSLNREVFTQICDKFGEVGMDLFTTEYNRQSHSKDSTTEGGGGDDNPILAKESVVSGPPESINTGPMTSSCEGRPADSRADIAPMPRDAQTHSVEIERKSNKSCCLQEFFSPVNVVYLEAEISTSLDLHYLPFNMGKHYCAIIFINEQIGEFVYLVEGRCGLPLPSALLPMDSPNVLCISSMLEGQSETQQPVLYLKCCLTDILREKLKIPLINEAREKALALAAQLQMSALEYERRKVTGTLESSSVRAAIAALGLSTVEAAGIKYRWLRSGKMFVEYQQTQYIVYDTVSGSALLSALGLPQLEQVEIRAEKRKTHSTLTAVKSCKLHVSEETEDGEIELDKGVLNNLPACSQQYIEYSVEVSMPDYFEISHKIYIPVLASARVNAKHLENGNCCFATETEDAAVELSIKFVPQYPGRYPCQILLQSKYDIRIYNIECVVNTDTVEAELEFVTPAYQAVIQDIPIANMSQQDWKLKAILKGQSFYGPPLIYVAPGETATYTLIFKPTTECITKPTNFSMEQQTFKIFILLNTELQEELIIENGKLILQNEDDGTDHVFTLTGIATKALALDHILIDCPVRKITQKVIMVPNFTRNELRYKIENYAFGDQPSVSSDLLIISGDPAITVEPGGTAAYTLNISPWKRGKIQGVISFVAEDGEPQECQLNNLLENTCGTQKLQTVNVADTGKNSPCSKVWFALEISGTAAPPEKTLDVECTALALVHDFSWDQLVVQDRAECHLLLVASQPKSLDDLSQQLYIKVENKLAPHSETYLRLSLDEAVRDPSMSSPNEDLHLYFEQMRHVAKSLNLDVRASNPKPRDTTVIEIPVTNPTNDILMLDVLVDVGVLSGEKSLLLQPKETVCYEVKYSPACTGSSKGSVIFVSEKTGEFWYALRLNAKKPLPRTLPEVECELGKWVRQYIPLVNPTYESLELKVVNNNSAHYSLEIDSRNLLIVAPCSTTEVPIQFCPSALGRTCHAAKISFICPQLEEWIFFLSGVGLIPEPQEPASVSACLGYHSSIIITFRNPTFEDVLVDVILTGISLPPKSKLDIPVLFAPQSMKLYEAVLVINVEKFLDENWSLEDPFELNKKLSRGITFILESFKYLSSTVISENGEIKALRWIYPICGIPEAPPYKSAPAVVCCQARSRVEERVEVLLTGVVPSTRGSQMIRDSSTPSKNKSVTIQDDVQVYEGTELCGAAAKVDASLALTVEINAGQKCLHALMAQGVLYEQAMIEGLLGAEAVMRAVISPVEVGGCVIEMTLKVGIPTFLTVEFLYDIEFESERVTSQLKSAVAINLVEKKWDPKTGIVTLVFNTVFAPNKPMRNPATLVVQCITGGIWKFPLLLVATEPEVDDVINIEATGLNKESVISFRLTSKTRYPEPYTAHFLPGSDPEFVVSPQAGELLPLDTAGTLITIGFKPNMYSKKHRATLVIQTQWMYEIHGLPPRTIPPTASAKVVCRNTYDKSTTVQQRDFVRENMKLLSTGVSSTIKGAPLILRAK
ncbi:PREDICTED: cilia- and flagella-associated protein 47 [Gekko japonicus]|uniref:Cilia- and flagella-associated protein 47 n=1 Tax=Gekko japonicus TaxID=146911 RepID=A0ABM1KT12_GEKJA|nr:PREDICTED: cilia- and flagella-associated protein 47 [Gekko japonicus]